MRKPRQNCLAASASSSHSKIQNGELLVQSNCSHIVSAFEKKLLIDSTLSKSLLCVRPHQPKL
jgi:hypothetical protein